MTGVLSLVAAIAPQPAAAGSPADVEGYTVIGTEVIEWNPDPGDCPTSANVDLTFTPATATWAMTGSLSAPFAASGYWGDWTIRSPASTGPYVPGTGVMNGRIEWLLSLSTVDPNCAKTPVCVAIFRTGLVATSAHVGSIPTPASGDMTHFELNTSPGPAGAPMVVLSPPSGCPFPLNSIVYTGAPAYGAMDLYW